MSEVRIDTTIEIAATPSRVWEVLTDLGSYPQWNPMIRSASGLVTTGERLTLNFAPAGRKSHVFRPKLMIVTPDRELRWLGNPRFPGVFDSQHYFILSPNREGGTRLDHGISYYGMVIPLVAQRLIDSTRPPFEEMNQALKVRAEQ